MVELLGSENLRRIVDKLHEAGVERYIDLPHIAVMGDTSSGKSSVLSALSGIEFPANHKLTTRCPTQIIMSHSLEFSGKARIQRFEDATSILYTEITTMGDIRPTIEKLTQVLVDEGQEISDDKIVIEVTGPSFPSLTLTDLPGLVRTVQDGEDPSIIDSIRALVDRYLQQSRTIILAVVPGNVDMHNSEILRAAEIVDPTGDRTIAIITKPDLVDKGAEDSVIRLLRNKIKFLKHGYHAVRCRNQKDLTDGVTVAAGIASERKFFEKDPWNTVEKKLVGIPMLQQKLVALLEDQIRHSLPAVREEIRKNQKAVKYELDLLGPELNNGWVKRRAYSELTHRVANLIQMAIKGDYLDAFFDSNERRVRAQLRKADGRFSEKIDKISKMKSIEEVEPNDVVEYKLNGLWQTGKYTGKSGTCYLVTSNDTSTNHNVSLIRFPIADLQERIANERGEELPIFPSFKILQSLVRIQVKKWEKPMTALLGHYQLSLKSFVTDAINSSLTAESFSLIKSHIQSTINDYVDELYVAAKAKLEDVLAAEHYLYTSNHYFYDNLRKLRNEELKRSFGTLLSNSNGTSSVNVQSVLSIIDSFGTGKSSNEEIEAQELRLSLIAYLKVAKKRFSDIVPMTLDLHLLKPLMMGELLDKLEIKDEDLNFLLRESPRTVENRRNLKIRLDALQRAHHEINF